MLGKELYSTSFSWFLLLEGIGMGLGPTIGGDFPSLKENLYILSLKKYVFEIFVYLHNFYNELTVQKQLKKVHIKKK